MFTENIRLVLESAGWSPNRRVSSAHWVKTLADEGFTLVSEAVVILESFGGLEVHPCRIGSQDYVPETIRFDPVLAASGDFDRVQYWQDSLKVKLSPIAEVGAAILMLAEDGRVFSCWDNVLWLDGTTFDDAMENTLIVGKRTPIEIARMLRP
jgi:hypothetical protein